MKTTNPDGVASDPTRDSSVRIVEWPAESEELEALATAGTPRLVLVEEGSEPPLCADCCQDWMWRTDDEGQKRLRLHHLAMRALAHGCGVPRLDPLGLLHVGLRSVHLPHKEQMLAAVLLREFNGVVSPEQLIEAAWPNENHEAQCVAPADLCASNASCLGGSRDPRFDQKVVPPCGRGRGDAVRPYRRLRSRTRQHRRSRRDGSRSIAGRTWSPLQHLPARLPAHRTEVVRTFCPPAGHPFKCGAPGQWR